MATAEAIKLDGVSASMARVGDFDLKFADLPVTPMHARRWWGHLRSKSLLAQSRLQPHMRASLRFPERFVYTWGYEDVTTRCSCKGKSFDVDGGNDSI